MKPLWRYRDFCDFKDGGLRHFCFCKHSKFRRPIICRGPICVTVPNFIHIGQAVAEIYGDLTVFQNVGRPHLGFWKFKFFNELGGCENHFA